MRRALTVKDMNRSYVQYVPRNLKPNSPLLFVFHGSGGDGQGMREITGEAFDALADANSFVVIYPDGFQTTWNDCRKASPSPARRMNIDDKSFIDAMIEKQVADNRIDRKRIFAAGWSNGGQSPTPRAGASGVVGVASISAAGRRGKSACTPTDKPMAVMTPTARPTPSTFIAVRSEWFRRSNGFSRRTIFRAERITKEPRSASAQDTVRSTTVDHLLVRARQASGHAFTVHGGGHNAPSQLHSAMADTGSGRARCDLGLLLESTDPRIGR
jgi:polyhydroxybutyrate depolymerase